MSERATEIKVPVGSTMELARMNLARVVVVFHMVDDKTAEEVYAMINAGLKAGPVKLVLDAKQLQ